MYESYFGGFYWVIVGEAETEAIDLVLVDRVRVKDANVHLPFLKVVCGYEGDAWGERLLNLACSSSVIIAKLLPSHSSSYAP